MVSPPVQEMSDARQAIQAAVGANAKTHAPDNLKVAEELMERASRNLERGAYDRARRNALAAKELAIQARDVSLAKTATAKP